MLKEQVYIVDDDSDQLSLSLGISEERAKELTKKVKIFSIEEETKTGTMKRLSEYCEHVNEFAWCVFIMGCETARQTIPEMIAAKLRGLEDDE